MKVRIQKRRFISRGRPRSEAEQVTKSKVGKFDLLFFKPKNADDKCKIQLKNAKLYKFAGCVKKWINHGMFDRNIYLDTIPT